MPRPQRITSRQHAVVQACRRLARAPGEDGTVLLDGDHLLAEALRAGLPLVSVLAADPGRPVVANAAAAGATVYHATAGVLEAASPVRTSTGLVAVARWTPAGLETVFSAQPALVVALVDVQDPGNLGAIIRAADGLGATGVVITPGSADPAGWRALRGAMGSTFHLPVARAPLADAVAHARRRGLRVAAAAVAGGQPIDRAALADPLLLLLGNEGAGLPEAALASADVSITIPLRQGANSLNVGVAAALCLYEATRQRTGRTRRP